MNSKVMKAIVAVSTVLMSAEMPQTNLTGVIAAQAAETTPTFSQYWFQEDGQWRLLDGNRNVVKGAWVCDDAVASNGKDVWYLIDGNGYMVSTGLVQDNTGNYYSLETNHYGNYGMLRHVSGNYDGINLILESSHSGNFAKITNADGINALAAKYGVTQFLIDNSNCIYTSSFNRNDDNADNERRDDPGISGGQTESNHGGLFFGGYSEGTGKGGIGGDGKTWEFDGKTTDAPLFDGLNDFKLQPTIGGDGTFKMDNHGETEDGFLPYDTVDISDFD